jgi:hypothetical protein
VFGSGFITLALPGGAVVETFSVAKGNVSSQTGTVSVVLMTTALLDYATDYLVTLPAGSIVDSVGHPLAATTVTLRTDGSPPRQDGGVGDDVFHAHVGNEIINGKAGRDSVIVDGVAANFVVTVTDDRIKVDARKGAQGQDTLFGVERLVFNDQALAFDTGGNAGQVYRLYQAAFDRAPDLDGLGFWIAAIDKGSALRDIAHNFIASAEFGARYGAAPSDAMFVAGLYANVLHRAPDQGGADYWLASLHAGGSREDVLASFSESAENQVALIGQISNGIVYHPYA